MLHNFPYNVLILGMATNIWNTSQEYEYKSDEEMVKVKQKFKHHSTALWRVKLWLGIYKHSQLN